MNKRSQETIVGLKHPRGLPKRGIGPLKRIKTDATHSAAKENLLPKAQTPRRDKDKQRLPSEQKCASYSTRQALKPRVSNALAIRVAHPISEKVVKSNLYDDENWIAQQQELFTAILNEMLETETCRSVPWDGPVLERIRVASFQYYQNNTFQSIVRRLRSVPSPSLHAF